MTRAARQNVETLFPRTPEGGSLAAASTLRKTLLDDQKRSFLRMVSHELRTPLNAVIGFSEMLSCEIYGPLGAPQYKEYAEHIRQSGHQLLALVNQILEIARLEGQTADLDLEPEPLDHALEDVIQQLSTDLKARDVRIDIADETALPQVMAESRGLRTMLFNLLQNAITWSPEGGTVFVTARERGRMIEINIRDEGEGVSAEDLPRLLRPFEQGESALTRTSKGAGLGLPIVQALSLAMQGGLMLQSSRGEGLTATLSLPQA